jgi:hypothetical protein
VSEDLVTWARLASTGLVAFSASPKATYRVGRSIYDAIRDPDADAEASAMLASLHASPCGPSRASIEQYLSSWHRNRASRYLRLGRASAARAELRTLRRYQAPDLRVRVLELVATLPGRVASELAKTFSVANRLRRGARLPATHAGER